MQALLKRLKMGSLIAYQVKILIKNLLIIINKVKNSNLACLLKFIEFLYQIIFLYIITLLILIIQLCKSHYKTSVCNQLLKYKPKFINSF